MDKGPEKVLIITYYWPPSGGAGVQRWLKFTKYLPAYGWTPVVLTVRPDSAAYPYTDNSLSDEVPVDVTVHRTGAVNWFALYNRDQSKIPHSGFASGTERGLKSAISRFIRGNFFIPDPRRGWNRSAFRKALGLIRSENIRHIVTTSPPHSTQLIGLRLKRRLPHLKWVADLRDPWTEIYYYDIFRPSLPARALDRNLEGRVLRGADMITTVGRSLVEALAARVGDSSKVHLLPNGYDEEDFQWVKPSLPERFTITYVGTLSGAYPIGGFIEAVKGITVRERPVLLRFVGTVPEEIRSLFPADGSEEAPEFITYCEHPEAISFMMSSSLLLLIIPDHSSARSILTGKLFEYLATGRPVLMLGPADGDAAQLLLRCGHDGIFDYNDVEGIRNFIMQVVGGKAPKPNDHHLGYSREKLTEKLAGLLYTL